MSCLTEEFLKQFNFFIIIYLYASQGRTGIKRFVRHAIQKKNLNATMFYGDSYTTYVALIAFMASPPLFYHFYNYIINVFLIIVSYKID
jgi:hypothetical protein